MRKLLRLNLLLLVLGVIGMSLPGRAQSFDCGFGQPFFASAPQYVAEQNELEGLIYGNISHNQFMRIISGTSCQPDAVYTIPVVVHVMDTGLTHIITDQQIRDAITGMNERWRRITGDGVDMEIQFVLASRDPNGNATNGIKYVDASTVPGYKANGLATGTSVDSLKLRSHWPYQQYVNIWVFTFIQGAAGAASRPSSDSLQGILMDVNFFKKEIVTLSHEMGHYMGLFHTYEGSTTTVCANNLDCLLYGDGVCDTPPVLSNYCGNYVTCDNSDDPLNSLVNYMGINCIGKPTRRFTQGQKDRVWATLRSIYRWSLVSSKGLIPITTTNEVAMIAIANPSTDSICDDVTLLAMVENIGNTNITTLQVRATLDGSVVGTFAVNGLNITPNTTKTIVVGSVPAGYGMHDVQYEIINVNGTTDYLITNNSICGSVNLVAAKFIVSTSINNGIVTGAGTYTCGALATFNVTPSIGYDFVMLIDSTATYIDTVRVSGYSIVIKEKHAISVQTLIHTYLVTTNVFPIGTGTITTSGATTYGSVFIATAHVNPGQRFVHWKKNGVIVSTDTTYRYTAVADAMLEAVFQSIPTGLINHSNGEMISLAPNPTDQYITLTISGQRSVQLRMSVINLLGQVALEQKLQLPRDNVTTIDVSMLPSGEYFLILSGDDATGYEKFIKK